MKLRIERRSEIALRSLQKNEQQHIFRALDKLLVSDRATLQNNPNAHIFKLVSRKRLYVIKASPRLRLVLSFDNETCVLEDIVDHDRLDRLLKREGQE